MSRVVYLFVSSLLVFASASCIYSGIDREVPKQFVFSVESKDTVSFPGSITLPLLSCNGGIIAGRGNIVYFLEKNDLSVRWSHDLGAKVNGFALCGESRLAVVWGNKFLSVLSVDAEEVIDEVELKEDIAFPPFCVDGRLFIVLRTGFLYVDGKYYKLPFLPLTAPAVADDNLYFATDNNVVYCWNLKEGRVCWEELFSSEITSPLTYYDGNVYFGSADKNLYCVFAESGKLKWQLLTGGSVYSKPEVIDDRLYCGSYDSVLYSLNPENGKRFWNSHLPSRSDMPPLRFGNFIVAKSFTSHSLQFYSLEDGHREIEYILENEDDFFTIGPVVVGDKIFVATYLGNIIALELLANEVAVEKNEPEKTGGPNRMNKRDKKKVYSFE